jgi:hypothetical protein
VTLLAVYLDAERAVHDWVSAHPDLSGPGKPLTHGAQYERFDIRSPRGATYAVVSRVGGTDWNGLDTPRISAMIYGPTKALAAEAAVAYANAVRAMTGHPTPMGAEAVCIGAYDITGPTWTPDLNPQIRRYLVDARFLLRPA